MQMCKKDARDARRKTDIDVIANAMEANYNTAGGTYKNFDPSTFITGGASALPTDPLSGTSRCGSGTPLNSRLCEYCGRNAVGTAITPGENLPSTCITGGAKVGSSVPVADTAFEVCATLENGTSGSRYYCRTNQR
ncbi:hypothetical protein M1437_02405 [Patescibacteria group bacterium]|nr:hypothetical protein [Patescibacteria group bacterium]